VINLQTLLKIEEPKILLIGEHRGIIQSILDFDYLAGKSQPSVVAIIAGRGRSSRYFFGDRQMLIPICKAIDSLDEEATSSIDLFAVAQSGRRALASSEDAIRQLTNVQGGMIFAESVPEQHALRLRKIAEGAGRFIVGPASVGMVVGGKFKLGAIGGTQAEQIAAAGITHKGSTAVISTSGGMINELISLVAKHGSSISFAGAVGGERFPIVKPVELFEQALKDKATKTIVFFGEVGGRDEYEIAKLLKTSKTKKPLIAYIAGIVAEKFDSAPQFGHAKALAQNQSETATAKKAVLREAGAIVADSFMDLEEQVNKHSKKDHLTDDEVLGRLAQLAHRSDAMFHSSVSTDRGGEIQILGEPLLGYVQNRGLSEIALGMFLGHKPTSRKTIEFFDLALRLLVDHGPQVSGAVNTMITARAGKDLPAALATGLLTIGPRFGGAINKAGENWFEAVLHGEEPASYVERFSVKGEYIAGIGHKKYRVDNPDPRVNLLLEKFAKDSGAHLAFAREVEKITTSKKGQLILNVDGAIAALLLDILTTEENYTPEDIRQLFQTEFCNAIFIFARSVGLIAHFMEQKRLDESLFRLPDDQISA